MEYFLTHRCRAKYRFTQSNTETFGKVSVDGFSYLCINTQTTGIDLEQDMTDLTPMQGFRQWWAVGASII